MYAKVKQYKYRLKKALNNNACKVNTSQKENEITCRDSTLDNSGGSPSLICNYGNDLDDFDLESSGIVKKNLQDINKNTNLETSTPDLLLNKPGPTKTIYSDITSKKSLSFDAFSPLNDSSKLETSCQSDATTSEANKSKGKFVFKKPSRLTMEENKATPNKDIQSSTAERIKSASERLKPLQDSEPAKCAPVANSSVDFQPPQFSKSSLINMHRPITEFTKENEEESDPIDEYEVPIDMDDDIDIDMPDNSKPSVINISDSITSSGNVEIVNNKEIPVDDDGWPEYRIEDFEDNLVEASTNEAEVFDLMENSMVNDGKTTKYEGMGDFHAGTQNDGITGKFEFRIMISKSIFLFGNTLGTHLSPSHFIPRLSYVAIKVNPHCRESKFEIGLFVNLPGYSDINSTVLHIYPTIYITLGDA